MLIKKLIQRPDSVTYDELVYLLKKDEYTEKLIEAIKAKARGELMEVKIEEKKTEKKNLIELLKASVE